MSADAETAEPSRGALGAHEFTKPRHRPAEQARTWRGQLIGGLTVAIVSFSVAAPVGALAIAPLGSAYIGLGVVIGLTAAIFGGLVAAAAGKATHLKSGPITATAVLWSAALTQALAASPGPERIGRALTLACLCVVIAGAMQVAMGVLRLGSAIKFVPYPVVAGFRNGIGILIILSQVPVLVGTGTSVGSIPWLRLVDVAQPVSVIVGGVVVLAMLVLRRMRVGMLAPFVAIVAGSASYYVFVALSMIESPSVVGDLPPYGVWLERSLASMAGAGHSFLARDLVPLLPDAASMAIVASIFALLAAKVMDQATHRRHDGNRELIAQGLGNVSAGAFGGIPVSGLPSQSLLAYRAGASGRATTVIACLVLLAALQFGTHWIGFIPAVALAGVMIVTGIDLFDEWSLRLLANLRRRDVHRPTIAAELAIVVLVTGLIVAGDLVTAVALGIVISAIVFISRMSRQVVRRRSTGRLRRSRRRRGESSMQRLEQVGDRIAVFELDGPLFFGTADRLASDVESFAANAAFVILDFRRVNAIDATGARILQQISDALGRRGARLLFSAISPHDPNRHLLYNLIASPAAWPSWFPDVDHALEWCEDRLLEESHGHESLADELPFADVDLCAGLDDAERSGLASVMTRRQHTKGSALFRRGDAGDELFVLLRGAVSLSIRTFDATSGARRLLTLHPGVTFGEMALLEGKPRSADAVFDTDGVTLALSRGAFDELTHSHPQLANKLLLTLARILAAHLRTTTDELRELER